MAITTIRSMYKAKIYNLIVRTEYTVKPLISCDDGSAN